MPETQQPTVPKAFATAPRTASDFLDRYKQSEAGQVASGGTGETPTMESQHVQAGGQHVYQPSPLDRPYTEQPAPTYQQPAVPTYQTSAEDRALMNQLAKERDMLADQVRQQTEALNQLAEERRQWEAKQREVSLEDQLLQSPDLQELETLDPEDARRVAKASARILSAQMDRLQDELARQRKMTEQSVQYVQQRELDAERRQWARDIMKAHPDFKELYKDPSFVQFLNGRDGYNRFSRDELATAEFNAGNTAYVIDMIDRFKRGRPNGQSIASVAPVQTAGAAYAGTPQKAPAVNYTLSDLNNLMQTRQISQDEYRKRLDALRAANS